MALENLKSVFNEGVGTKEQSDLKSIYNSSPASNTETTSVTGFLGPQNNFIQDFNPPLLGAGSLSGNSQTEGIKDLRITTGVGSPFPNPNFKIKVSLKKFGNRASIYFLGAGDVNYKNWGGYTKVGDTVAITPELTNFGPPERFLNQIGFNVPDIPLPTQQITFYPPIKYTDTVFELRGSDATTLAREGYWSDPMKDLRGTAMQVMKGNRDGKTIFTLNKTSFVKFVNTNQGSAVTDVNDFIEDSARDLAENVVDLTQDAASGAAAYASGVSNLIKDIDLPEINLPPINLPPLPTIDTSGLIEFKDKAGQFGKALFDSIKIDTDFKFDFRKIKAPTVDLPFLKGMGSKAKKLLQDVGDILPNIDFPDINFPGGGSQFELGEGGQRIANAFSSVGKGLSNLVSFIPPISFPEITLKPTPELLDLINDVKVGATRIALHTRREAIEFTSGLRDLNAQTFKAAKDRTSEFVQETKDELVQNYQNLENKLADAVKPIIPGYGEGGGTALAGKNPRELINANPQTKVPGKYHAYSELGTTPKSLDIKYEKLVNDEKATIDGINTGDPIQGETIEKPILLTNKHKLGNTGNIHSGLNQSNVNSKNIDRFEEFRGFNGNELNYQQKINEEDPLDGDLTSPTDRKPTSIATKHLEEHVSSYSGLDITTEKYQSNVKFLQLDTPYGDDERTTAGNFYPDSLQKQDLHTLQPLMVGNTLSTVNNQESKEVAKMVEDEAYGMPFYFKDLRDNKYIIFRGYLENITEDLNPSWNSHNYVGRSEAVYTYSNTERNINFTFKTFAHSQGELHMIYEKINTLTSMVYPRYKSDKGLSGKNRMRPPYTSLRIGELFGNDNHNMTGFIKSINYSWPQESPWEVERGKRVPKLCNVTIGYQVVHREPPSYDTPSTHFHGYLSS